MNIQKILITGSSGFIGRYLTSFLIQNGMQIVELTRNPNDSKRVFWNPQMGILDYKKLEGIDAVINLAGENIFGIWNDIKKKKILESRVNAVRVLSEAINKLNKIPQIFMCASAVGYYGKNPSEVCDETSPKGEGFLSDVCESWEYECRGISNLGIRTVNMRFGLVLDSTGGVLQKLESLAKYKITIKFGEKKDVVGWISLRDLARAINFTLNKNSIEGVVNFVEPVETSLFDINELLKLRYKTFINLKIPKFLTKFLLGEMGESLVLSSCKVVPKKLLENGFDFLDRDISVVIN